MTEVRSGDITRTKRVELNVRVLTLLVSFGDEDVPPGAAVVRDFWKMAGDLTFRWERSLAGLFDVGYSLIESLGPVRASAVQRVEDR